MRTPELDAEALQALSAALRAQLGSKFVLRVTDATPSEPGAELTWAAALADRESAAAVLWVTRMSEAATIWIAPRRAEKPLSFRASEERDFDRARSLAIGASSILHQVHAPRQPETDELRDTAATQEEPKAPPSPADRMDAPFAPVEASASRRSTGAALAAHVVVGPVLRIAGDGTLLGFDSALGLRLHPHFAIRARLALSREQSLSPAGDGEGWMRNRLAGSAEALARFAYRGIYLHAGIGLGLTAAQLTRAATDRAADAASSMSATSPTVVVLAAGALRLTERLFIEVPLIAAVALGGTRTPGGVEAAPAVELSASVALGFGSP